MEVALNALHKEMHHHRVCLCMHNKNKKKKLYHQHDGSDNFQWLYFPIVYLLQHFYFILTS